MDNRIITEYFTLREANYYFAFRYLPYEKQQKPYQKLLEHFIIEPISFSSLIQIPVAFFEWFFIYVYIVYYDMDLDTLVKLRDVANQLLDTFMKNTVQSKSLIKDFDYKVFLLDLVQFSMKKSLDIEISLELVDSLLEKSIIHHHFGNEYYYIFLQEMRIQYFLRKRDSVTAFKELATTLQSLKTLHLPPEQKTLVVVHLTNGYYLGPFQPTNYDAIVDTLISTCELVTDPLSENLKYTLMRYKSFYYIHELDSTRGYQLASQILLESNIFLKVDFRVIFSTIQDILSFYNQRGDMRNVLGWGEYCAKLLTQSGYTDMIFALYYYTMGRIYMNMHKFTEAEMYLNKAMDMYTVNGKVIFYKDGKRVFPEYVFLLFPRLLLERKKIHYYVNPSAPVVLDALDTSIFHSSDPDIQCYEALLTALSEKNLLKKHHILQDLFENMQGQHNLYSEVIYFILEFYISTLLELFQEPERTELNNESIDSLLQIIFQYYDATASKAKAYWYQAKLYLFIGILTQSQEHVEKALLLAKEQHIIALENFIQTELQRTGWNMSTKNVGSSDKLKIITRPQNVIDYLFFIEKAILEKQLKQDHSSVTSTNSLSN